MRVIRFWKGISDFSKDFRDKIFVDWWFSIGDDIIEDEVGGASEGIN